MNNSIFTRIKNDVNGNSRIVCHFMHLLTEKEREQNIVGMYNVAIKRANTLGGRKYHNKTYGGGIVFQGSESEILPHIQTLLENLNTPKPIKSNSFLHPVFSYLIDNLKDVQTIKLEYGTEVADTIKDRLQWTLDTFRSEYIYPENLRQYKTEQKVFENWLMGVPSAMHVDIYYSEIIKLAKQWGDIPKDATEKQEGKICSNWYNFIANKFFQLCRKHGVK